MSEKQKITACLATTLTRRFYETLFDGAQSQAKFAQRDLEETLRDKYREYWQNVSEKSAFVTDILESFTSVVRQFYPEMMPRRTSDLYFYLLTLFVPTTSLEHMDANQKGIAINDAIVKIVDQVTVELLNGNQLKSLIHSRQNSKARKNYINTLQARIIYIIGLVGDEIKTELSIDTMHEERNRNKFVPMAEYLSVYNTLCDLKDKFMALREERDMLQSKLNGMKRFQQDDRRNSSQSPKKSRVRKKTVVRTKKPVAKVESETDSEYDSDDDSQLPSNVSDDSEVSDEDAEKFYPPEKPEKEVEFLDDDDDDVVFK